MEDVDVAVIGTGLAESIVAAALAKNGRSVAQLDHNPWYGGAWASLSVKELVEWCNGHQASDGGHYSAVEYTFRDDEAERRLRHKSRQFAIALTPTLIPASSSFVDTLVASGVSRYVNFRLLEGVGVLADGQLERVPASKEEIFRDPHMSLMDKRRLMKFLMWAFRNDQEWIKNDALERTPFVEVLANPPHSLPPNLLRMVFCLAQCNNVNSPALPALKRLRQAIASFNKFGPSPFLIGQYGGSGEVVGGFARVAAVNGAVQIVGRHIDVEIDSSNKWVFKLTQPGLQNNEDGIMKIRATQLVISNEFAHTNMKQHYRDDEQDSSVPMTIARGIVILPTPLNLSAFHSNSVSIANTETSPIIEKSENVLIVIPASESPHSNAVYVMLVGSGSLSCPEGHQLLHFTTLNTTLKSASSILKPVLHSILTIPNSTARNSLPVIDAEKTTTDDATTKRDDDFESPLMQVYFNQVKLPRRTATTSEGPRPPTVHVVTDLGGLDDCVPMNAISDWAVTQAEGICQSMLGSDVDMWASDAVDGQHVVDADDEF